MMFNIFRVNFQFIAVCLVGITSAFSFMAAAAETTLILKEGGPFHGEEIKASGGSGWFGLYKTNDGFELRKVALNIFKVHDPVIDTLADQKSGKLISVVPKSKQKNIILIKPQSSVVLNEGKVKGTLFDSGAVIYPGQSRVIKLDQNLYSLVATGVAALERGSYEPVIKNYSLQLFFKQLSQLLFSEKEKLGHDGSPQVIWAGDLDRDGKLDLLLNLTKHYNTSHLVLMLSSWKKEGQLLETVAELLTTGC
jgi:hypothetical protein